MAAGREISSASGRAAAGASRSRDAISQPATNGLARASVPSMASITTSPPPWRPRQAAKPAAVATSNSEIGGKTSVVSNPCKDTARADAAAAQAGSAGSSSVERPGAPTPLLAACRTSRQDPQRPPSSSRKKA